jgi:hypothetical protein
MKRNQSAYRPIRPSFIPPNFVLTQGQSRPTGDATYAFYAFLWTKDARDNAPDFRLTAADDSMRFRLDCCGFVVE